jgi:pseudouridine-5'-phosphate glycosidase
MTDRRPGTAPVEVAAEVAGALRAGRAVVALESSVFAQGLKAPANREAYHRMNAAVRTAGAVPAVTAVVAGQPVAGITDETAGRFLTTGAPKVSARDIPWAMATGGDGATTVAGTLCVMRASGLDVFATGGIGGVHRDAPLDESADLLELARTSAVVVCAGAKSILDLPATVERLETFGVTVVGYRTREFPGFFTARTGLPVSATAEDPQEVARALLASRAMGRPGAILVAQPPPESSQLDHGVVERAVARALAEAGDAGVRGAAVTPFLLGAVERATGGASVRANLDLLEANAALAGRIAVALTELRRAV